jgi:hypothetical protein
MTSLLKRLLKALWNSTLPVRRPLTKKIEDLISRSAPKIPACRVSDDTGLLMDLMVRELVRLQKQLDELQQSVDDLAVGRTGLSVVGEDSESRSMAG